MQKSAPQEQTIFLRRFFCFSDCANRNNFHLSSGEAAEEIKVDNKEEGSRKGSPK